MEREAELLEVLPPHTVYVGWAMKLAELEKELVTATSGIKVNILRDEGLPEHVETKSMMQPACQHSPHARIRDKRWGPSRMTGRRLEESRRRR